jgi:putative hemolysin
MLESAVRKQPGQHGRFKVYLAVDDVEIAEAQQLRHKVFAEEMGAKLATAHLGLDIDPFDRLCDHLLVRDTASGEVVGTYRILPPSSAKQAGYYSEHEFDLTRFHFLRPRMAELGRSCVHPDYRSGSVIALLWMGLADYMARNGCDYVMGCASIGMNDGGHLAAGVYRHVSRKHLSPVEWRVFPRNPLPLESLGDGTPGLPPPLIKGYLRAGAMVCGEPAWDPDFNTADLLMLLPLKQLNHSHMRHFMNKTS